MCRPPTSSGISAKVWTASRPSAPCIVTADEFDTYPPKLGIRSFVNGEKRQDSNTGLQIFDIDHVIHELSQGMTLKAGTIIATGTPGRCGHGHGPAAVFEARRHGALRDRRHWQLDQHRAVSTLPIVPNIHCVFRLFA